jgi:surfactin family lipopeptide synthetase A
MYQVKLSPYAKTFYNEWLLEPDGCRYNMLVADQTFYGQLDVERLGRALHRYVLDYVLLNSHVQEIEGEPYWVKNNEISALEYVDQPLGQAELLEYVRRSFDIYTGPLYRFKLLYLGEGVHRLIIVLHHLVMDGISLNTGLFETISNYYNDEKAVPLCSLDSQIEKITALEETLSANLKSNKDQYKAFWHEQLDGVESIDLRFLKSRNTTMQLAADCNPVGEIRFSYGESEQAKLERIHQQYKITPYSFSQGVFAILLHRYTGNEQLAVAYPIAIKEYIDFMYGAQINLNLIPYKFSKSTTILEVLSQSLNFFDLTMRSSLKYGYYPIANILQEKSNNKLLDVCFSQSSFRDKPFTLNGITKVETSNELSMDGVANDVLLFEQEPGVNQLNYRVKYDKRSMDEELLINFINSYKKLFFEILDDLDNGHNDKYVNDYDLLEKEQYQKMIYDYNKTEKDYPREKTIHQMFEEQVDKTPDQIALVSDDVQLTYHLLNERANQLAYYIRKNASVNPDDLIVLFLDRTEFMFIAALAALKVGGAYVPVDVNSPDKQISHVLNDSKAKVILTNSLYQRRIAKILEKDMNIASRDGERAVIPLLIGVDDKETKKELSKLPGKNLEALKNFSSANLAYVIYTSGTTGVPKGVMVEHKNVINFIFSLSDDEDQTPENATFIAPYAFDASILDMWPNLLLGHKLHIVKSEVLRDAEMMKSFVIKNKINKIFLPAALLKIHYTWLSKIETIKKLVTGVEPIGFFYTNKLSNIKEVINGYGLTETTVYSICYKVDSVQEDNLIIPLGKPMSNTQAYVLDNHLSVLPIGAIGELFIGGDGVARGYLNRPELTKERFISNPFKKEKAGNEINNDRLYKTGDFVRMLPDGNLEYIERRDSQLKIKGYRIELGQIEHVLASYPGIKQAIVLAKEQVDPKNKEVNNKKITAYYVAQNPLDEQAIRKFLVKRLPDYMLPSSLCFLKEVPLTTNDKLDFNSLPEPILKSDERYIAPNNEKEKLLCDVFSEILRIPLVGINDDFFKLGGDSLSAIKLTSILQANFDIRVSDVFNLRTPKNISKNLLYGENILKKTLEGVKEFYKNKKTKNKVAPESTKLKLDNYLKSINQIKIDPSLQKEIKNILLTGGTGYLGCNILNELLELTNYHVFLLVRADTQEIAINRIKEKFKFYFDKSLDDFIGNRVTIVKGNLEAHLCGMSDQEYQQLATKVDSIIHAAALVKHYGEQEEFYSANVLATTNLLELCRLTNMKDFHYISTLSVLNFEFVLDHESHIYTEDDEPEHFKESHNLYNITKLQGELQTIKYRDYGIKSNIYRVGNLAFISENFRPQKNIENNAFFNWLQCLLKIESIAEEISTIEISQVDLAAKAVVKIFDKEQLNSRIYHVFNPNLVSLTNFLASDTNSSIKVLPIDGFIDLIMQHLANYHHHDLILKFLLRQGWLDGQSVQNATVNQVLQGKTQEILKQLNFEWPLITLQTFERYLAQLPL